jgi:hypothetical protein
VTLTRAETLALERAQRALPFADGLSEAGFDELGGRIRLLAGDVIDLLATIEAERSARVSIQAHRDRCLKIIAGAAYDQIRGAR